MKTAILVSLALATITGCSVAARSPQDYAKDTSAVLSAKNGEIQACYDGVLKTTPGAAGRVTVKFDMPKDGEDNAGTVTNVAVDPSGTTAPPAVADCVTKTITGAGTLNPPDQRLGQATYVWEFSAPPPAAPAAPPKS
jgi:hypothetical protein